MLKIIIICICSISFVSGCASSYKEKGGFAPGYGLGYEDRHVKGNTYFVSYTVHPDDPMLKAIEYLRRRASELCTEKGFKSFNIMDVPVSQSSSDSSSVIVYFDGARTRAGKEARSYVECVN